MDINSLVAESPDNHQHMEGTLTSRSLDFSRPTVRQVKTHAKRFDQNFTTLVSVPKNSANRRNSSSRIHQYHSKWVSNPRKLVEITFCFGLFDKIPRFHREIKLYQIRSDRIGQICRFRSQIDPQDFGSLMVNSILNDNTRRQHNLKFFKIYLFDRHLFTFVGLGESGILYIEEY